MLVLQLFLLIMQSVIYAGLCRACISHILKAVAIFIETAHWCELILLCHMYVSSLFAE